MAAGAATSQGIAEAYLVMKEEETDEMKTVYVTKAVEHVYELYSAERFDRRTRDAIYWITQRSAEEARVKVTPGH